MSERNGERGVDQCERSCFCVVRPGVLVLVCSVVGWSEHSDSAQWGIHDAPPPALASSRSGSAEDKEFAVFYLREGSVIAVDAVNLPVAFMVGKQLVQHRKSVCAKALSDPRTDLKSLV